MNTIQIKKLKKYFSVLGGQSPIKAVDDVSFDVKQGEIFGFLGPNGAGKTTTIRCMMDFIRPNSGTIKIASYDAQKDSVLLKKDIGYLSSDMRLYENWTGQDHIDLLEKIRGRKKYNEKLISKLIFNPKIKVRYLSSGNKQKLNLILALMHQPKILILDEPTIGLDPLLQNTIYQILKEFQQKGATIFMSSHNLAEVEKVCSRVAIIKSGKLIATESIAVLKSKKIYMVDIIFTEKYELKSFEDKDIEIISQNPNQLTLKVKTDINKIVKLLSKYNLKSLQITHASLEDIFLEFYKR